MQVDELKTVQFSLLVLLVGTLVLLLYLLCIYLGDRTRLGDVIIHGASVPAGPFRYLANLIPKDRINLDVLFASGHLLMAMNIAGWVSDGLVLYARSANGGRNALVRMHPPGISREVFVRSLRRGVTVVVAASVQCRATINGASQLFRGVLDGTEHLTSDRHGSVSMWLVHVSSIHNFSSASSDSSSAEPRIDVGARYSLQQLVTDMTVDNNQLLFIPEDQITNIIYEMYELDEGSAAQPSTRRVEEGREHTIRAILTILFFMFL